MICSFFPAAAQTSAPEAKEPVSEYVEGGSESAEEEEGGGLLDFLPFVGGESKEIQLEKLLPSPQPRRTGPELSKESMAELQMTASLWIRGSEFTEPTVRQDKKGRYYRDYVVFADEYEAEIRRGDSHDKPFIGYIYVKGDYFKTESHETPEAAQNDFAFQYQPREFRIIFHRIEKWEYSDELNGGPFVFSERWEFRNLQSRVAVDSLKKEDHAGQFEQETGVTQQPQPSPSE
jgi:hypothetical protein